ncbi:MAG: PQQ-binding-like beta-propeller repeat protein [Candidatus Thermoplasmatota archaeon]|nr:PQQ-binding-like beta-propeller repeat protein [Candidatus Thermoplasmatota archaeon]
MSNRFSVIGAIVLTFILIGIPLVTDDDALSVPADKDPIPFSRSEHDDGPLDWPMYMANTNHTGYSPSAIPLDNSTLWSAQVPSLKATDAPVVYGDLVFMGSGDGYVRGYDIDTGKVEWSVYNGGHHVSRAVAAHEGDLFFGADNGFAYSFDISSRMRNWQTDLNASSVQSTPTVAHGMVFIGTHSLTYSNFYALDRVNGSMVWYLSLNGTENSWGFQSSAAYHDGMVFVGDGWGNIYCLDADGFSDGNDGYQGESDPSEPNADIIWTTNLGASIIGSPMLAEGRLFIANSIGRLFCMDAGDGTILWNMLLGGGEFPSISTTPAYHNGTIYVTAKRPYGLGGIGGSVFSIDIDTQRINWRFNITNTITESSPVVNGDYLIFCSRDHRVYCLRTDERSMDDDERKVWTRNYGAPITSTVAVANGRIFVARPDPFGGGLLFAIGTPDPIAIDGLSISDPFVLEGEMLEVSLTIRNNGTVPASCDVSFEASSLDFQTRYVFERREGVRVDAFGSTTFTVQWRAVKGYPIIAALIYDTHPRDRDQKNNLDSLLVSVESQLQGYWTSTGSGPGLTSASRKSVASNRTLWERAFERPWSGAAEDMWLMTNGGAGSASAIGSTLFMVDPEGALISMEYFEDSTSPDLAWSYRNASVNFMGRPALLIDRDQSMGFPNKVFCAGDDLAIWAFDWIGFKDADNDGDFISEEDTSFTAGDVIWRTPLSHAVHSPLIVTGANVVFRDSAGTIRSYDDDTGELSWSYEAGIDAPFAADTWNVYIAVGGEVVVIDSGTGERKMNMSLEGVLSGDPLHLSISGDVLLVAHEGGIIAMDNDPDDNADGVVDEKDDDEGVPDTVPGRDLYWHIDIPQGPAAPPAFDYPGTRIAFFNGRTVHFMNARNGTEYNNVTLDKTPSGRIVAGDRTFHVLTGTEPWHIRSFSPLDQDLYSTTWELDLLSEPMGELAIAGGHILIPTRDGLIRAVGALNTPPVANIMGPTEGMMIFPDEEIELDASGSFDPEGDPLTYRWSIEGRSGSMYEGGLEKTATTISGIGTVTLVLRVFDDMMAYSEDRINLTILKRVTYPDFIDYVNDVKVRLSYGISDPNGRGIVNIVTPEGAASDPRIVYSTIIEFRPLPSFAAYRFEWVNISIGYAEKAFPVRMVESRLRLYHFEEGSRTWLTAPHSGVDTVNKIIYGNLSGLHSKRYAIGILDNDMPEMRHVPNQNYVEPSDAGKGHTFKVEYRDADGDDPMDFRIVIDNTTTYPITNEGFLVDNRIFSFYLSSKVQLPSGQHSYYFEVSDGSFIRRTGVYSLDIPNRKPIVNLLASPQSPIKVRQTILFDAGGSYDDDGDELTFSWDFDLSNGIQREKVGPKVDHTYYEVGTYTVTLTVYDGTDTETRTITLTIIDDESEQNGIDQATLFLLLLAFVIMLAVALVIFLVLTRKGSEPTGGASSIDRGWACPECGTRSSQGNECDECGYEYDPIDFEDEGPISSGRRARKLQFEE